MTKKHDFHLKQVSHKFSDLKRSKIFHPIPKSSKIVYWNPKELFRSKRVQINLRKSKSKYSKQFIQIQTYPNNVFKSIRD